MTDPLRQWRLFWGVMTAFFFLGALFWLQNVPRGTPEANLGASTLFFMGFSALGAVLWPTLRYAAGFLVGAAAYAVAGLIFSLAFVAARAPGPGALLADPLTRYNFLWVMITWPLHLIGLVGRLDFLLG